MLIIKLKNTLKRKSNFEITTYIISAVALTYVKYRTRHIDDKIFITSTPI